MLEENKKENEPKHPRKKESEAVCWKGRLLTLITYGQTLTDEDVERLIQGLINDYQRGTTTKEQKAEIIKKRQLLDPPAVIGRRDNGSMYYGVSDSGWQLGVIGWKKEKINSYKINDTLGESNILTSEMQRIFFAQISAETGFGRLTLEEASGDNYDITVNPKKAKELGNTDPGDGRKYKGAGYIQLTGKGNYSKFQKYLKEKYGIDDPKIMTGDGERTPAQYVGENYSMNDYAGALVNVGQNSKPGATAAHGMVDKTQNYNRDCQEICVRRGMSNKVGNPIAEKDNELRKNHAPVGGPHGSFIVESSSETSTSTSDFSSVPIASSETAFEVGEINMDSKEYMLPAAIDRYDSLGYVYDGDKITTSNLLLEWKGEGYS